MWPHEGGRDPERLQYVQRLLLAMVSRVIKDEYGVLSPVGTLFVQLSHELADEDNHHLMVGVDLRETGPNTSIRAEARDQADAWRYVLGAH